ncbi:MAG: glycosyltransferase family protein [Planctomycetota bacterium]
MKRVLMIAYYFPPDLAVGSVRTVKFCKYLPQFGWQPVVVTHQPGPAANMSVLAEVPAGTEVHRVGRGDLPGRVLQFFRSARNAVFSLSRMGEAGAQRPQGTSEAASTWRRLRLLLYWPDLVFPWIVPAVRRALLLARHCDAVYSSGPPVSCHLAARRVAMLSGLPWVMDYRDPWTLGNFTYPSSIQQKLFEQMERNCIRSCACLVNVNDTLTSRHRQAYSDRSAEQFVTIHNGFDPEDFANLPPAPTGGALIMSYVGNFSGDRTPSPLLAALAELRRSGQLREHDLRLKLVGDGTRPYARAARELGIADMVCVSPRVPYRQALLALAASHVAVLFGGDKTDAVSSTTKVYEYLYADKTILAIIPHGWLWDLLSPVGALCFPREDVEGIKDAVLKLVADHKAGRALPKPQPLPGMGKYSRRHAAGQLASILDSLV